MDEAKHKLWALDERSDPSIPTATLQIYNEIDKFLRGEENANVFRASAANGCVRKRWYKRNGYVGSATTPRASVNFLLGNLSEHTMQYFIKRSCVGDGKIYSEVIFGDLVGTVPVQGRDIEIYKQQTLSFKLGELTVTGHADGFGKRNADGQWELIEIKSASDYGFKTFQVEGPEDYLKQSHTLMMTDECRALNILAVRFFYLRKSTGHVWDRVFNFDDQLAGVVVEEFMLSARAEIPAAPYDFVKTKTGETTIVWQCQYCAYLDHCKPGYELGWKKSFGSTKPTYIYKEQLCNSVNEQTQTARAPGSF